MNAQRAGSDLRQEETIRTGWLQRAGLFILFLLCEAVIFIFGSYYFDVFAANKNLSFNFIAVLENA